MADDKTPETVQGGTATAEGERDESVLENAVNKAKERRDETIPFSLVSESPLPRSMRSVVVEVPRAEWSSRLEEFFKEVKPNAAIEGFRKGKVPMKLLQRRFSREASAELVERIVPNIVRQYEKQKETVLYGNPTVTDFNTEGSEPIRITLELEVKPDIKPQNYTGRTIEAPAVKLTDEMVDRRLEQMRQGSGFYEEVDAPMEPEDQAIIDWQATNSKGHTAGQGTEISVSVTTGDEIPEDVRKALVGAKAGDELEQVSSDGTTYKINVRSIKKRRIPELNDEFASEMGETNLAALREKIQAQIQSQINSHNEEEAFEALVTELVSEHDFEVPPALKAHVERDIARQDYYYMAQTGLTPPRLRGLSNRSDYQAELDRAAEQRVKGFLLLDAIGRTENIAIAEEDLNSALEERAQQEGRKAVAIRANLERRKELENFKEQVRFSKIRNFVLSKTTINYVEATAEQAEEALAEPAEDDGEEKA